MIYLYTYIYIYIFFFLLSPSGAFLLLFRRFVDFVICREERMCVCAGLGTIRRLAKGW